MAGTRLAPCGSACSTSGRPLVPQPTLIVPRRAVRTFARKLTGGGKSLLQGDVPPRPELVTNYPKEFEEVSVGVSTLESSDAEPDVELLLPETLELEDATATVDEANPYTVADTLSAPSEGLAGGEPALEALLAEGGADLSAARICSIFPFPLDTFQRRALELFLEGASVVVCAPTGAGKTAIAEAAAAAALARGQRVIYTTPLKALSNQKLFETRRRFGHARCGLQTGDVSLNADADIVVMTTEILRNIMYRTAELAEENNTGSGSTREARLGNVGLIVLDEVHYLGDPHRGSVWEEVIINCPRHIQLLAMSATVANPKDLGDWIGKEHMRCETITTRFRPVPLTWRFAYHKPSKGVRLEELLQTFSNSGQMTLNPALSTKRMVFEEARAMLMRGGPPPRPGPGRGGGRRGGAEIGGGWERGGSFSASASASSSRSASPYGSYEDRAGPGPEALDRDVEDLLDRDGAALRRRVNMRRIPDTPKLISRLAAEEMLPAIWFILSRRDCDQAAARAASAPPLTSPAQQQAIAAELAALRADTPEAVREELVPSLLSGIASHHAGQLPGWKGLVERLFQRGLLQIVFATGTLAAGINMPARTTVISALSRMTDEGPKPLPHNELLQMAGRAGRRGYDTTGNCVVLQNKFEGAEEAWDIIRAGPEPLASRFAVSYGLVLNLLSVNTLEQCRQFVSRSFGSFLATEGNARRLKEAEAAEAEARMLVAGFKASADEQAKEINARVKEAKDELRRLKEAQLGAQCESALRLLRENPGPRQVVLNLTAASTASGGSTRPLLMPALLVGQLPDDFDPASSAAAGGAAAVAKGKGGVAKKGGTADGTAKAAARGPYFVCLSADNRLMRASVAAVTGVLCGEEGACGAEDAARVMEAIEGVRANAWSAVEAGSLALTAALGSASTSAIARGLGASVPWTFVEVDPGLAKKVSAQRAAVKAAVAALEGQRRTAAKASNQQQGKQLENMARAKRLLKKADRIRSSLQADSQLENTWKTFQSTMEILICVDALELDTRRVLPLGLLARNIQGGNELWLAMCLQHPALHSLPGPALGALLGALASPEVMAKPVATWAAYTVSPEVEAAVSALEPQRQLLLELQTDAGLLRWNDALAVDLRFAGLVEAWASGATWGQIMADSGMDDGDMARLLIRTIDLLKQVKNNDHLLPELKEAASEALRGMDRKPVAELVM
ncbi:hypothetical protein HYH03_006196 [Edaphochlamys debaryana]|uniref:Uncharacterized protein n=1 Tax=Edaphochlamys debaryana TaxID=47281 RepID=A0A836C099_9CHLO|nr:hypothetical protein HYH03_006196 [Edaphochlamys debaryana]|eukprot:KAG2495596.1 hypothetical protein HYH03_006196 [Edaphochlamys debaryana]